MCLTHCTDGSDDERAAAGGKPSAQMQTQCFTPTQAPSTLHPHPCAHMQRFYGFAARFPGIRPIQKTAHELEADLLHLTIMLEELGRERVVVQGTAIHPHVDFASRVEDAAAAAGLSGQLMAYEIFRDNLPLVLQDHLANGAEPTSWADVAQTTERLRSNVPKPAAIKLPVLGVTDAAEFNQVMVRVPATWLAVPTRAAVTICNTPTGRRLRVVVGDIWGVTGTPSMQSQGVAIAEQSQVVVDVTKVVGVTLKSSGGKVEAAASWSGVERVAATAGKPGGSDSGPITCKTEARGVDRRSIKRKRGMGDTARLSGLLAQLVTVLVLGHGYYSITGLKGRGFESP
ncbi:hypothetical protein GGX14DRAFT_384500 [Mycena pura]|uniref:Uncharacterized protein n=1 Tax=Mycena pura TaxID=153505 RepID=A0AAD6YVI5_9AGAR|nr:hypothetical protein GGX14DRAFT_384500 [Mycena pura]